MAQFRPKAYDEILERLLARVVARSTLTDVEPGGQVWVTCSAIAREIDDLHFQLSNLQRLWDIDTAQDTDLDERAVDYNPDKITRGSASKAALTCVFSRPGTTGEKVIPAGRRVRVPGGGPAFVTTAAGSISDGNSTSAPIPAIALDPGSAGNVDVGTVTQFDAIPGVTGVTNDTPGLGGQDEETDPQFRSRLKAYARSLARGTMRALEYAARSTTRTGYGAVRAVQVRRVSAGLVRVWIDDGVGTARTVVPVATETVVASAGGGETRVRLAHSPVVPGFEPVISRNAVPLVPGSEYTLSPSTGEIIILSGYLPNGLNPTDTIEAATYSYYGGLVEECQQILSGSESDPDTYPGYAAGGTTVIVAPATVIGITVRGSLVVSAGYDPAAVRSAAITAVLRYCNSLEIQGDIVVARLIAAVMSVPGVEDVAFSSPIGNYVVGDGQVVRLSASNVEFV